MTGGHKLIVPTISSSGRQVKTPSFCERACGKKGKFRVTPRLAYSNGLLKKSALVVWTVHTKWDTKTIDTKCAIGHQQFVMKSRTIPN